MRVTLEPAKNMFKVASSVFVEQIFMRNSFVLIVSAIIILRKKGSLFGPAKYQPYLFGRSFFGFLG